RGVPDRPVAGEPPPKAARAVALQPLESLAPRDRRPLRGGLADAPADLLRGRFRCAVRALPRLVAEVRVHSTPGASRCRPGGLSDDGVAGETLADHRLRGPGHLHGAVPGAVDRLGAEARLGRPRRLL